MLEMGMESLFAVVHLYFVSSLGTSAVATVGLTGVYWSVVSAESLAGLVGIVLFRLGRWKQTMV
jgi:Na+-driven multidrug efflux pump